MTLVLKDKWDRGGVKVPLDLVESQDLQDLERKVIKVLAEILVCQEPWEFQVQLVLKVWWESQAHKVLQVLLALRDSEVKRVFQVLKVKRDPWESLARKATRERKDLVVSQEKQDRGDCLGRKERQEPRDLQVLQAQTDIQDQEVNLDFLDYQDHGAHQDLQGIQGPQVCQDPRDPQDPQAILDALEVKVIPETRAGSSLPRDPLPSLFLVHQDLQDNQEPKAFQAFQVPSGQLDSQDHQVLKEPVVILEKHQSYTAHLKPQNVLLFKDHLDRPVLLVNQVKVELDHQDRQDLLGLLDHLDLLVQLDRQVPLSHLQKPSSQDHQVHQVKTEAKETQVHPEYQADQDCQVTLDSPASQDLLGVKVKQSSGLWGLQACLGHRDRQENEEKLVSRGLQESQEDLEVQLQVQEEAQEHQGPLVHLVLQAPQDAAHKKSNNTLQSIFRVRKKATISEATLLAHKDLQDPQETAGSLWIMLSWLAVL